MGLGWIRKMSYAPIVTNQVMDDNDFHREAERKEEPGCLIHIF